jgi:hypothetical protein
LASWLAAGKPNLISAEAHERKRSSLNCPMAVRQRAACLNITPQARLVWLVQAGFIVVRLFRGRGPDSQTPQNGAEIKPIFEGF